MVTCLSPNGTTVYSGPGLPDRLLVGTLAGVVTAERAPDGFRIVSTALPGLHISSLLFEPTYRAVFASTYAGGTFVSHDEGTTWRPIAAELRELNIYTLASSTSRRNVTLYAGTEPVALYRSLDYGTTWHELPGIRRVPNREKWTFPAPPHQAHLKNLAFAADDASVFYASIEQGGAFKTTDGGETWTELEGVVQPDDKVYKDIHRLVIHPTEPATMFITGGDGLGVSHDGGTTWQRVLGRSFAIGYPDGMVINPLDPSEMFLSGSKASPGTWLQSHSADAHVARSTDAGRSFEVVGAGLPDPLVGNIEAMSLSVAPGDTELFVATTDGEVYVSRDSGEHFQLLLNDLQPISKAGHYRGLMTAGR